MPSPARSKGKRRSLAASSCTTGNTLRVIPAKENKTLHADGVEERDTGRGTALQLPVQSTG